MCAYMQIYAYVCIFMSKGIFLYWSPMLIIEPSGKVYMFNKFNSPTGFNLNLHLKIHHKIYRVKNRAKYRNKDNQPV